MFFQPQITPYDLTFRLFGFPIRVSPFFFLLTAILGWNFVKDGGFEYLFIFVACFFVSILVHELGHAFLFRVYNRDSHIWLLGFGGLAIPDGPLRNRQQRIIVSLAGPFAGFLLFGLVWWTDYATNWSRQDDYLGFAYFILFNVNLFLNLLNLMPIYPLDGGQVSRELFTGASPHTGLRNSLMLSIGVALVMVVHGIMSANGQPLIPYLNVGGYFMAMMFGLLAYENYMMLEIVKRQDSQWR